MWICRLICNGIKFVKVNKRIEKEKNSHWNCLAFYCKMGWELLNQFVLLEYDG